MDILTARISGPIHAVTPHLLAWPAVAVVSILRHRKDDSAGAVMILLAAGLLFAAPVAYSFLVTPILWYVNRYLIVATPVLILLLVGAWESRGLHPPLLSALALHISCASFYLHDQYRYR